MPYCSPFTFPPKYFLSGFHTLGLGRQGQNFSAAGLSNRNGHLASAISWQASLLLVLLIAFPHGSLILVAWQISSDTNDCVFCSEVLHTSSVLFCGGALLICLYARRQDSTGNETRAEEAAESLGHLAHITWWTEEPLIAFWRKVLWNMQVFLLSVISQASYSLSPLKQRVLQCLGKWGLKAEAVMVKQHKASVVSLWSLLIKWEPHLWADKENPNHFVSKTWQGMWTSGSIHVPFRFFRLPAVSQHSRKASCVGPSLNPG